MREAAEYYSDGNKVSSLMIESVVPFVGMVGMEGCTIALTIMTKTVISGGTTTTTLKGNGVTTSTTTMSPFVFVVYTNVLGTLFLFPFSWVYHRSSSSLGAVISEGDEKGSRRRPVLPLIVRYFFMGFTGIALAQNLAFMGLVYSSPIVVCAMGLLTPAFSFILDILLRTSKTVDFDWSKSTVRFKLIGTLVSVMGAVIVQLYKGPYIREAASHSRHLEAKRHRFVFYSLADDSWTIGCLMLAASSFCVSVWNNIQMDTVKRHPEVMKVASFYSLAGTIQCAIFASIMERDINAWKLNLHSMEFLVIFLAAIFGSVIRSGAHIWSARAKGGLYASMFQPFRIVWATFFGVGFFVNGLHYGSVIGTVVCGMGYYAILWGKIKEDEGRRKGYGRSSSAHSSVDSHKVPLLIKDDSQV